LLSKLNARGSLIISVSFLFVFQLENKLQKKREEREKVGKKKIGSKKSFCPDIEAIYQTRH
jgi:hypothetical protein